MIRSDEVGTKPELLAVPAWEFEEDGWRHARVAILRSVKNGVPMARTARDGLSFAQRPLRPHRGAGTHNRRVHDTDW